MAQPDNTFDSYDAVGIREDLSDIIYNVSPEETPFYSKCKKTKATNTLTEWQTERLRASRVNAHIEGDDTTAEERTPTTRLGNRTQIFKDAVVIPDTDDGLDKAGRASEMTHQIVKVAKEQKLDIELALFANQESVGGSNAAARFLAGVPAWLTTNTTFEAGNGGADPIGDGTDTRTDDGTPVAFSQARFDSTMQSIWENGGRPNTVYLAPFQMNAALGFEGNNNQRAQIDATKATVARDVVIYRTPWGTVEFQMSREARSRDVFIMQDDMWKIAVERGTRNVLLGKTGDNTKRQVVTELTLCALNEAASGAVYDNTTA